MKQITLLRHAKSSWADPDTQDHDRTLNQRGQRDASDMGERLRVLNCIPDHVVCSTAVRTRQTAALLLPVLGISIDDSALTLDARIYDATLSMLFAAIADLPSTARHVFLIGHNPGLEQLCHALVPRVVERMPTMSVSSLEVACKDWSELADSQATLLFHDFPKNGRS